MSPLASPQNRLIAKLAELRLAVAVLGSRPVHGWWDCSFLDGTGQRYLEIVFPRSALSAGLVATVAAAQALHDREVGRVGSFHLFRLPPDLERRLSAVPLSSVAPSGEASLENLRALSGSTVLAASSGPVSVRGVSSDGALAELAARYLAAFEAGVKCFPYFTAEVS